MLITDSEYKSLVTRTSKPLGRLLDFEDGSIMLMWNVGHYSLVDWMYYSRTILQINPNRCTILLSIFISLLYMFRATMCPSSEETSRPDTIHTEWQIPVSYRYSNFSWWWAHGCPKLVEKKNKYTKQNCAPSSIYLQACTRMQGQQNIKYSRTLEFAPTPL